MDRFRAIDGAWIANARCWLKRRSNEFRIDGGRLQRADLGLWNQVHRSLNADGYAILPRVLTIAECRNLSALYGQDDGFRTKISMARHGFGRGEYKYFSYPLPDLVDRLRHELFPRLAPIANEWNRQLGIPVQYPELLEERVAEGLWKIPSDLPERGRQYDAQRLGGVYVELKSHLPIDRQTRAIGATWLDHQLIGGGKGLGDTGFGGEAKQALQERTDFLAEQGLVERRGQRTIFARNLLTMLRNRELARAAKDIAADTGLEHHPLFDGQRVAGIYRRSIMRASGRYAMLDDGMEFSLVPWRPVIEQRLGQQIAATVHGGRVFWEIGRQRSPSV